MNRRSFLKSLAVTTVGVCVAPSIVLGHSKTITPDHIAVLRHKRKVKYKGIDWRLDVQKRKWGCEQLYGETKYKGERLCYADLFEPEDIDKVLRYHMDYIVKRFERRKRTGKW